MLAGLFCCGHCQTTSVKPHGPSFVAPPLQLCGVHARLRQKPGLLFRSLTVVWTESLLLPLMCMYLGLVVECFEVIELLEYQMIFVGAYEKERSLKGGFIAECWSLR